MNRKDWSDLAVIEAVALARSFSEAGRRLGVSASAISHAVRDFETRHDVRLFNRTTRSVAPTDASRRLLDRLAPAIKEIRDGFATLDEDREEVTGTLRIAAHRMAADTIVLPLLSEYGLLYPKVTVELVLSDGLADVVAAGVDAGIRHEGMMDQDMIAMRIAEPVATILVASPSYLASRGRPDTIRDLEAHRTLRYRYTSSRSLQPWILEDDGQRVTIDPPATLISNDVDYLIQAALAGLGITQTIESHVREHLTAGRLERVLPRQGLQVPANYLYYPGRRQVSASLRAFIQLAQRRNQEVASKSMPGASDSSGEGS